MYVPPGTNIGILLFFGNRAPTTFDSSYMIPGGTTAFVSVKMKRRKLIHRCIDQFRFNAAKYSSMRELLQRYAYIVFFLKSYCCFFFYCRVLQNSQKPAQHEL